MKWINAHLPLLYAKRSGHCPQLASEPVAVFGEILLETAQKITGSQKTCTNAGFTVFMHTNHKNRPTLMREITVAVNQTYGCSSYTDMNLTNFGMCTFRWIYLAALSALRKIYSRQ